MSLELLKSTHLYLRSIIPEDLPELLSIHNKRENMQYISNGKYCWTEEELQDKYFPLSANKNNFPLYFAVCLVDTKQLIGEAAFFEYNNESRNIELGFIIDHKCHNKGYGYELINIQINYAFLELNAHSIICRMYAKNKASVALAQKCSMSVLNIFTTPNKEKAYTYKLKKDNKPYYIMA